MSKVDLKYGDLVIRTIQSVDATIKIGTIGIFLYSEGIINHIIFNGKKSFWYKRLFKKL